MGDRGDGAHGPWGHREQWGIGAMGVTSLILPGSLQKFNWTYSRLPQSETNCQLNFGIVFRWFTLKPPYTIGVGNFFSAIWNTSHWISLSNLDSRHLMTSPRTLFGQIWNMSILASLGMFEISAKMGTFTKSKISWKQCANFCFFRFHIRSKDEWATWWDHFWWGATHLRGCYRPLK